MSRFGVHSTHVYWDVDQWKPDEHKDPRLVYSNVKSALQFEGFCPGPMSIRAYGDKAKTFSDDLTTEYFDAGIDVENNGDQYDRVHEMLIDMVYWAWNNSRGNLVVISKI
ncbi:uncharacterized protein LOC18992695 [Eutrema salsugineum]|uniref:uncharacterized protein LOC18992695 n=1 Tax=Eutrema salsugineum TaxID=72664 RepID=UPI000CED774E|nr:uncharacterized protein LOC18992695 [Eutrema salsugineum]